MNPIEIRKPTIELISPTPKNPERCVIISSELNRTKIAVPIWTSSLVLAEVPIRSSFKPDINRKKADKVTNPKAWV
ncbi:MAG: Uncharacterised protein [Flavobacteriaceae bacterium]|nr:MAG: Uncharacterised protein [Flavobacteriaceae bacterium]